MDAIILIVFAVAIVYFSHLYILKMVTGSWSLVLQEFTPPSIVSYKVILGVGAFIAFWLLNKSGGMPLRKSAWNYPPLWLIACTGYIVFVGLALIPQNNWEWRLCTPLWPLLIPLLVKTLYPFTYINRWSKIISHALAKNEDSNGADIVKLSPAQFYIRIKEWVKTDEPCLSRLDDLFDHRPIATNLVNTITSHEHSCIALLAPLGMGKTTVLTWTQNELINNGYTISRIDAWGRDKKSFVKQVLSKGINDLRHKVDVLPFLNVPSEYVDALSGGNTFKLFKAYLKKSPAPLTTLQRLDDMLGACNTPLVFIIEDVDRNTATLLEKKNTGKNKTEDFLKVTFPAFLDRASKLKNISFVLAIDASHLPSDILCRVCNYSFSISLINRELLTSLILKIREEAYEGTLIDPQNNRDALFETPKEHEREFGELSYLFMTDPNTKTCGALISIMSTPRMVKYILRDVLRIWKKIPGEIDFDHLLIITALKYAYPSQFSFVQTHLRELRYCSKSSSQFNEKSKKALWEQLENEGDTATTTLIKYLFSDSEHSSPYRQGFVCDSSTDYWIRIEKEQLGEEPHDQDVLADLVGFSNASIQANELSIKIINNREYAKKVAQFSDMLEHSQLQNLTSAYFEDLNIYLREESPKHIDGVAGFQELHRCFPDFCEERDREWLQAELIKFIRTNLPLANTIFLFWGKNPAGGTPLPGTSPFDQYTNNIRNNWESDPETLASALRGQDPGALSQLCKTITCHYGPKKNDGSHIDLDRGHFFPDRWTWLPAVLTGLIDGHYDAVFPELAVLLTAEKGSVKTPSESDIERDPSLYIDNYFFEGNLLNEWFCKEKHIVIKAFKCADPENYNGLLLVRILAIKKALENPDTYAQSETASKTSTDKTLESENPQNDGEASVHNTDPKQGNQR